MAASLARRLFRRFQLPRIPARKPLKTKLYCGEQELESRVMLTGDIQVLVWHDVNGNGVKDPGDDGLGGRTVYLDVNHSGFLDSGDLSQVTDANGDAIFLAIPAGKYTIVDMLPSGWAPSAGLSSVVDVNLIDGEQPEVKMGSYEPQVGTINGTIWNDTNGDGIHTAGEPGLANWTVFLDTNSNGSLDAGEVTRITSAGGAYSFAPVASGVYDVVEVVPAGGWLTSPGFSTSKTVTVPLVSIVTANFSNYLPTPGTITGTVYNDQNNNGNIGGGDPGVAGITVFADLNHNAAYDGGEPTAVTPSTGKYTITGVPGGLQTVREILPLGWTPASGWDSFKDVTVNYGATVTNNFLNIFTTPASIGGTVWNDANADGLHSTGEAGQSGVTVFLDANANGATVSLDLNLSGTLDAGEPSIASSKDLYYTPAANETGNYAFSHLAPGTYHVREVLPVEQSATPISETDHVVTILSTEDHGGVNFGNIYRGNEIHGVMFEDFNGNHFRDLGEPAIAGAKIYVDLDRDHVHDVGEPGTITGADGSYSFTGLIPGSYVVRHESSDEGVGTYPTTVAGTLWPTGVSNPAVDNVTPTSIMQSLAIGQTYSTSVSLTLPGTGAITNMVDVFLLFDDTGSFTSNSPIVRAAFPAIISSLQASMPGTDLGFGVGRFEEYGNFAAEFSTGRPFVLNQPIVSAATPGFSTAIQSALDRTAPGYGGDGPETLIEALYQTATGVGFDGNNNGSTSESGPAGIVNTQVNPGVSGDVPAFSSFSAPAGSPVLPAAGNVGGAGFRPGALPIILAATDIGTAYQPRGERTFSAPGDCRCRSPR